MAQRTSFKEMYSRWEKKPPQELQAIIDATMMERETLAGLYPDPDDPRFAARLFSKREFYDNRAVAAGRENDRPDGRNQPSSVIEVDPDGRAAFGAEDSHVPGAGTALSRRWTPIVCIPPCVPSSAGSAGPSVSRRPKMGGRAERKHHHQSRKGSPDFHRATVRVDRSFMYGEICREASTPREMRRNAGTIPHSHGLPEHAQWCSAHGVHDSNQ